MIHSLTKKAISPITLIVPFCGIWMNEKYHAWRRKGIFHPKSYTILHLLLVKDVNLTDPL
jgi:hypothetical protein